MFMLLFNVSSVCSSLKLKDKKMLSQIRGWFWGKTYGRDNAVSDSLVHGESVCV